MNQFKKYLSLNLGLVLIAVVAYFYMVEAPKLVTTTTKPIAKKEPAQRATAINYEGAMVVNDLADINDILAEIEENPPAGGESFDLATMAKTITAEALKAFSDSDERALPLVTHWNVGESDGMDPMYMMSRIEKGEHILVSWKLDPYYSDTIGNSYYEESIKKAASLKLPLVFVLPAPESALTKDSYYRGLDKTENPNVVNTSGKILNKLSPFAPDSLWNEIGEQWSSTSLMSQLQEWYPNPPLVLFVSEDEAAKLSWSELSTSSRYTKYYPSGKDDNYKRTLLGAKWIEKYRQMHDGFKKGFSKSAWKNNVKFVSYNNFSENLGKTSDWVKESTLTNQYINVWPLTADGATLNFDLSGSKTDATANAPHILANNLPFMINEAKVKNPNFAYQLNLNANSKVQDAAQYRGLTQFALWFLRPSTIRQASSERGVESLEPLFQEVADSVELIHYNDSLAEFWKNGTLVSSGDSDLNANIPEQYKNDPRWFLLDTDKNPKRPWSNSTSIDVWAFALVKGKAPNREWLVYVQSPSGDVSDVTVTIPGYKDVMVDGSVLGSFYSLSENGKTINLPLSNNENTSNLNTTSKKTYLPIDKQNIIIGTGIPYYIDSLNGNDTNDGLSEQTAWKSITKVIRTSFSPGDSILFKRNQQYHGTLAYFKLLKGKAGNPITIGSYGNGDKPKITTIKDYTLQWQSIGSNIWEAVDSPDYNPQRIKMNKTEILRASSQAELNEQYTWYYDQSNKKLLIYSKINPNNLIFTYSSDWLTLQLKDTQYINIQDIEISGGASYSIHIHNSSYVNLNNVTSGDLGHKAIYVVGSDSEESHHIIIDNCIVDSKFTLDYANSSTSSKGHMEGIMFTRNVNNSKIKNSYIKNWGHSNINLYAPEPFDENNLHDIEIYQNFLTSPDIAYGGRFSIDGNTHHINFHDNIIYDISVRNQINGHDNKIINNYIDTVRSSPIKDYATGQGLYMQSYASAVYNNTFENNTIINTESAAFMISGNLKKGDVYNNKISKNIFKSNSSIPAIQVEKPYINETQNGIERDNIFSDNLIITDSNSPISYYKDNISIENFNTQIGIQDNFIKTTKDENYGSSLEL